MVIRAPLPAWMRPWAAKMESTRTAGSRERGVSLGIWMGFLEEVGDVEKREGVR